MVAEQIWLLDQSTYVSGSGFTPVGDFYEDDKQQKKLDNLSPALEQVLIVCGLCNNSSLYRYSAAAALVCS